MSKTLTNYILPLALFPALSVLAFRTIFGHFLASGLASSLKQQCPLIPTSLEDSPYRLVYVGVPVVDKRLCGLVALFHLALSPGTSPFLSYFLGTALPLLAIPALESFRRGRHSLLALPVVFGLVMQLMTVGAILPIYWLIFIITGSAQRRAARGKTEISQEHAEGVILGLAVGAGVPSVCISLFLDPYVTAVWQFFPLLQFLIQTGYLLVRRSNAKSGYSSVRALYVGIFLISAVTHISSLVAAKNIEGIKALLLPSAVPLTAAPSNLQVRDFLQWDAVFAFGSTLLASLWFAKNVSEVIYLLLWNGFASVVVGPGAAIAAVAFWRESQLHAFPSEKKSK
ncbi:hypothetical protein FB451DRAFT_634557 [Mycena latifolia]|nr:hypothetical protein FB451DRAFT_634557 [Mycena latifolia]